MATSMYRLYPRSAWFLPCTSTEFKPETNATSWPVDTATGTPQSGATLVVTDANGNQIINPAT